MIYKIIDPDSNHYFCKCKLVRKEVLPGVRRRIYHIVYLNHSNHCLGKSKTEDKYWASQLTDIISFWLYCDKDNNRTISGAVLRPR